MCKRRMRVKRMKRMHEGDTTEIIRGKKGRGGGKRMEGRKRRRREGGKKKGITVYDERDKLHNTFWYIDAKIKEGKRNIL